MIGLFAWFPLNCIKLTMGSGTLGVASIKRTVHLHLVNNSDE